MIIFEIETLIYIDALLHNLITIGVILPCKIYNGEWCQSCLPP